MLTTVLIYGYGDGTRHFSVGTFNSGEYNNYKDGPYNNVYPKLNVYIAKAGVTAIGHGGQESGWTGSNDPNGPPDRIIFLLTLILDRFSGSGYRGDWQHIGQIFSNNPDTNSDEPYYLSEYEFDIPAELRGPDCYICRRYKFTNTGDSFSGYVSNVYCHYADIVKRDSYYN